MDKVIVRLKNHSVIQIECDKGIAWELRDEFSFFVPGYKFMPAYRNGPWDGKIRLFDYNKSELPAGLYGDFVKFCKGRNYQIVNEKTTFGCADDKDNFDVKEVWDFCKSLKLSSKGKDIEVRDYQFDAICKCLESRRSLLLSPTGSGKSLIIYCLIRWWMSRTSDTEKALVIVPTTQLVEQMYNDFEDYSKLDTSWNVSDECHKIYGGKEKVNLHNRIFISTWQSIYKLPSTWFQRFAVVIGDEAHGFTAKSMNAAMAKSINSRYRVGTTGTLSGAQTHELQLKGVFGPKYQFTNTKKLQDEGTLAPLDIEMLQLVYPEEVRSKWGRVKYQDEIKWLVGHESRNRFIVNLANSLEGNTLVLFRYVETHGKILYANLQDKAKHRVFYVAGAVETADREAIRAIVESQKKSTIVASEGVFSTGVNIKNIHNIIFAAPSKSQIRVLQSIGRGLRIADNGQKTTLYDLVDYIDHKSYKNYALRHGEERYKIYKSQQFNVTTHKVNIK